MPKSKVTEEKTKSQTAGYLAHRNLKQAIYKESSPRYANMGGIGVTIPESWNTFDGFIKAVGMPPDAEHTVPLRKNPDNLKFSASNFYWGTADDSRRNRASTTRYKHKGKLWTVSQLAEEYGVNISTLRTRLRSGWPLAKALSQTGE